ncbi:hypothetical protein [Curtobacterium sp. AB7]|uniref:hypothetical protein n=1 Tax=Curtobacterium sp. AB7 TaxID=3349327 RepID=UPI003838E9E5
MTAGSAVRIEFAPALFTRELAAYYLSCSLRDIDDLRSKGELIPVGETKRIKFRKEDLDRHAANLAERS